MINNVSNTEKSEICEFIEPEDLNTDELSEKVRQHFQKQQKLFDELALNKENYLSLAEQPYSVETAKKIKENEHIRNLIFYDIRLNEKMLSRLQDL